MTIIKNTIILSLGLFLIGCTGLGVNFKPENITLVKIGKSTKQEIRNLFGKTDPTETVVLGDLASETETYFYRKAGTFRDRWNYKFVTYEYIKDTVNGYLYNNSFEQYSTDFDETKISNFILNKTTRLEVVNMLGSNYGEVILPSNLLVKTLSEKTIKTIPDKSKYVLVYYLYYLIESGDKFLTKSKLLVLSFNSDNLLINKYFTENKPSN